MHKFDFISYKRHFQLIMSKFWLIVYITQSNYNEINNPLN